jgi:hypothetical protein
MFHSYFDRFNIFSNKKGKEKRNRKKKRINIVRHDVNVFKETLNQDILENIKLHFNTEKIFYSKLLT